jgi:hypothetical protein
VRPEASVSNATRFERHVVARPHEERADNGDGGEEAAAAVAFDGTGDDPQGEQDAGLGEEVDQGGHEPGSDPGEDELQLDTFRCRDRDPVLVRHDPSLP